MKQYTTAALREKNAVLRRKVATLNQKLRRHEEREGKTPAPTILRPTLIHKPLDEPSSPKKPPRSLTMAVFDAVVEYMREEVNADLKKTA